jgi:hypothetical protein
MRSKQLVRIAGKSDALVIDFAPTAPKGKRPPEYQIALAVRGHEHHPLEIGFTELVSIFEKLGATSWYLAYLSAASLETMNIDPVPTVEADLAPFAKAYGPEVTALIDRAKKAAKRAGVGETPKRRKS